MTPAELSRAQIEAILSALETTRAVLFEIVTQASVYSESAIDAATRLDVDIERLRNLVVLGAR